MREGLGVASVIARPESIPVDGELLRLQAENSALQKNMAALQKRYDLEVHASKRTSVNGIQSTENENAISLGDGESSHGQTDSASRETVDRIPTENNDQNDSKSKKQSICVMILITEVELQLQMEREEKKLLKEQLQALELQYCNRLAYIYMVISFSYVRLQMEKETLYNDSRTKIDEIQQKKEEDLKSLNIRNQKLQADLQAVNQTTNELKEQLASRQKEHELALHVLKNQVECQSAESQEQVESILSENDALRTNLAALEQIQTTKTQEMNLLRDQNMALTLDLEQIRSDKENFLAQIDDLNSQLQEAHHANGRLLEQLTELGQERDSLQQELEESRKTADKRKSMLDEMAIEMAQEKSFHKEELSNVRLQHEKEVLSIRAKYERELRELHEEKHRAMDEVKTQLNEERTKIQKLEGLQHIVDELQQQIQSMESTKGWFERRLKEAEETIEKNLLEYQDEVKKLQAGHNEDLQRKEDEKESIKQTLAVMEHERDAHASAIVSLKQEIKDTLDGQRILEKKGSSALKDLKRQLHLERKRADKLQERLQEILTNTKTRTGLEELVLSEISSPSRTQTGDSSSVSSFSYREMMKEGPTQQSGSKSNTSSPQSQRPADLSDDEISELFQRLAEVQQEKWMLEEKVKHLEVSCSSMAEDICKKSAIIETYVMESRIDVSNAASAGQAERGTLSSVLRDLVKPGDENLREMNKKLQNMLEEQLTKNMHLQKDLEVLSQEIVRLSKECASSPSQNPGTSG
ncbi:GRAP1 protein, partial [Polypterus senegalus]